LSIYVSQLLEDLVKAKENPRPPKIELAPELEFVRGAEEFLHGKQYPMSELYGIDKKQFPPIEKLTKEQTSAIVSAFIDLWTAFNIIPEFPSQEMPDEVKYELMVSHLDEMVTPVSQGYNHFEFCIYDKANCTVPEKYCICSD